MNVSAEEIKAAAKDETSPFSCGDELPAASEGNGDEPAGSAPRPASRPPEPAERHSARAPIGRGSIGRKRLYEAKRRLDQVLHNSCTNLQKSRDKRART